MTLVGKQLGNYQLTSLLGQGGFAEVYLGEHIYLKTQAAVKVSHMRISGEDDMESFVKEARMVASLSHPHIVRILDFGIDNETPFLVMDYAPNGTLRQRHKRGEPLPLPVVVPYVRQVAEALQYAHDEKLVHRDIKPENLLLGRRNEILLSDFGIALVAQSSRYQSTQDVIGTVAYMSPEQIQGKPRPASDQYSLGIVVYEWLGGARPFSGSFTELCAQHMFAPVPPLREKVPGLSPDVEKVVLTALAKDPKQRFNNVRAFANALEQASQQSGRPIDSIPTVFEPPAPLKPLQPAQKEEIPARGGQQRIQVQEHLPEKEPAQANQRAGQLPLTPPPARQTYPPISDQTRPPQTYVEREKRWGLDKKRLLAMLIGTMLYLLVTLMLDNFLIAAIQHYSDYSILLSPLADNNNLPAPANILYSTTLIIPLFFSTRFGPWVGIVVGFAGIFLGDLFSSFIANDYTVWYVDLAWLPLGFIAGLAFIKTQGNYNTPGAIGFGLLMGVLALLMHTLWQTISVVIHYQTTFSTQFFTDLFSDLFPLILLFLVLLISRTRDNNRQRSVS